MSKEFKKGDKVSHPMWGNGGVIEVDKDLIYPVRVEFKDGQTRPFTTDGKYFRSDNAPSLYHGHGTFEIKFTPEPEPKFEWQWKIRNVHTGRLHYTDFNQSEEQMREIWEPEHYEIVDRDESTKREVKP